MTGPIMQTVDRLHRAARAGWTAPLGAKVMREGARQLEAIHAALAGCGIGGIYADFADPADAIYQMARWINRDCSCGTEGQTELAGLRAAADKGWSRLICLSDTLATIAAEGCEKDPRAPCGRCCPCIASRALQDDAEIADSTLRVYCRKCLNQKPPTAECDWCGRTDGTHAPLAACDVYGNAPQSATRSAPPEPAQYPQLAPRAQTREDG